MNIWKSQNDAEQKIVYRSQTQCHSTITELPEGLIFANTKS